MSTRFLRIAALSATMLLTPTAARLVLAADDAPKTDAPKPDAKDNTKPADGPRRPGAAGGPEGRRPDAAGMLERIESALNDLKLSEEQKTKARELLDKVHKAADEAKGDNARAGMGKMMTELREGLDGLLTEEQRKQLAEKAPFLAGGGPGGPGAGRPGGRPGGPGAPGGGQGAGARPAVMQKAMAAALEKVGLSDEQKTKLKALSEEFEKKTRSIIEEGKGDRAAIGEKLRPLAEERRTKMAEILSTEQMTKFQTAIQEELQKARGENGGAPGGPNGRRPGANRPGGAPDAPKTGDAPKGDEKKTDEKKTEEKKTDEKK
jgi:hypothetical protein